MLDRATVKIVVVNDMANRHHAIGAAQRSSGPMYISTIVKTVDACARRPDVPCEGMNDAFIVLGQAATARGHSAAVSIGSGLVALILTVVLWPLASFAITIAHEGGHAFTASLMGGEVTSIEVNGRRNSTRGRTVRSELGPLGNFLTKLAGYLGPSVFGLIGTLLLVAGKVVDVLWLSLFFLVLALVQMRNLLGAFAVVVTGGLIVLTLRYLGGTVQAFLTYVWIWFLLLGGFAHVIGLQRIRAQGSDTGSDAYNLRLSTHLPASLFSGFFWLFSLLSLLYGGVLLLGIAHPRL